MIKQPLRVVRVRMESREPRFTIVDASGQEVAGAAGFLRHHCEGTGKTYAYLLVDVLRWASYEGLSEPVLTYEDFERYITAQVRWMNGGIKPPWTNRRQSVSANTLKSTATVCNRYLIYLNPPQVGSQEATSIPTRKAVVNQLLLGHLSLTQKQNRLAQLAPASRLKRRPSHIGDADLIDKLIMSAKRERDAMIFRWLNDGGFRIGELLGLHFADMHLRVDAECRECSHPHVHVCDRIDNPNGARSKAKIPWTIEHEVLKGGSVRLVSPEMIHSYFRYITRERPSSNFQGCVLLSAPKNGEPQPLTADAVRKMMCRHGKKLGIDALHPHWFRHRFATRVTEAAGGDAGITALAGGWKSRLTVEEIYNHPQTDDPTFLNILNSVWMGR